MPNPTGTQSTRQARLDARGALEDAQFRLYHRPEFNELSRDHVARVAEHLQAGHYGANLAGVVQSVDDPRFSYGLAQVLIAYGHPAAFADQGIAPSRAAALRDRNSRPGHLMRQGLRQMNTSLGVGRSSAGDPDATRLHASDVWGGHLASRVRTVQQYALEGQRESRPRREPPAPRREPTLLDRWTAWSRTQRVVAVTAAVVATGAVVGVAGSALTARLSLDDADLRDFTAHDVGRQINDGHLPSFESALDQVRTLAPGVGDPTDQITDDIASARLDDARSVAYRALRQELQLPRYEEDRTVRAAVSTWQFDPDNTLVHELDDDVLTGLVDVMAATGINDVREVLDQSAGDLRIRANERGMAVLAEAGLASLGDASEGRGNFRVDDDFSADGHLGALLKLAPLSANVAELGRQFYAETTGDVPAGGADTAYNALGLDPDLLDRTMVQFAREADADGGAALDWITNSDGTFDLDRTQAAVLTAAVLGVSPQQAVTGPLDAEIKTVSNGRGPGGWEGTAKATALVNRLYPDQRWSSLNHGLDDAGRLPTPGLSL